MRQAVVQAMRKDLLRGTCLQVDETAVPVQRNCGEPLAAVRSVWCWSGDWNLGCGGTLLWLRSQVGQFADRWI